MNETRGLWRGKRIDNGEWVEGVPCDEYMICGFDIVRSDDEVVMSEYPEFNYVEIDPSTLGECTGLRDKNGKLIFEGDILRGDIPSCLQKNQNCIGFVRYGESAFLIDFCKSRELWETQKVGFCSFWNYEVIGNIHDNPELCLGRCLEDSTRGGTYGQNQETNSGSKENS